MMDAPEAFGVLVRAIGLIALMNGLWCLYFAVCLKMNAASPQPEGKAIKDFVSGGILFVFLGFVIMRGADMVVKMAY